MTHKHINPDYTITMTDGELRSISSLIESELGIKCPPEKRSLLVSRLTKRLHALHFKNFGQYYDFLLSHEGIQKELHIFKDLVSTHETSFFREPSHFEVLKNQVIPELIKKYNVGSNDNPLRILSAACSTGEEVYSIAFTVLEFCEIYGLENFNFIITGTDLSVNVIETAKRAVYPELRTRSIPDRFKLKYMMKGKPPKQELYRIVPELRNRTNFFSLNLLSEDYANDDFFHVIFIRNALIYFNRNNQYLICNKLIRHLINGGFFFTGHSEALNSSNLSLKKIAPAVYIRS